MGNFRVPFQLSIPTGNSNFPLEPPLLLQWKIEHSLHWLQLLLHQIHSINKISSRCNKKSVNKISSRCNNTNAFRIGLLLHQREITLVREYVDSFKEETFIITSYFIYFLRIKKLSKSWNPNLNKLQLYLYRIAELN